VLKCNVLGQYVLSVIKLRKYGAWYKCRVVISMLYHVLCNIKFALEQAMRTREGEKV